MLIGAKSETAYVGELVSALSNEAKKRTRDTSGKLTLGELFALIHGAACVVTNDTGPMHFSIALGRPTVCLFGPASPEHYGVRKANVEVLYHHVYCSPCAHELEEPPCEGNNVCMKLITLEEVLSAVERQLGGVTSLHTRLPTIAPRYSGPEREPLGVLVRAAATLPKPLRPREDSRVADGASGDKSTGNGAPARKALPGAPGDR